MAHPPFLPAVSPLRGSALLGWVAVLGYRQLRATEKEGVALAPLVPVAMVDRARSMVLPRISIRFALVDLLR